MLSKTQILNAFINNNLLTVIIQFNLALKRTDDHSPILPQFLIFKLILLPPRRSDKISRRI